MSAHIVNTSDGRDAYELIKSGIMGKMSFGFNVRHATMDYSYTNAHQYPLRKVDSLDLMEVSAVRFPAYLDTNIEARNSQEVFAELEKRGFNVSLISVNNLITLLKLLSTSLLRNETISLLSKYN